MTGCRPFAGEPDLHRVTRSRAVHLTAILGVVPLLFETVPFTTLPLPDAGRSGAAPVDRVVHRQFAQVAPGHYGDRLRVAIGDREAVHLEVRHGEAERGDRVVFFVGYLRHREGKRNVLFELGPDERLGIREVEAAFAVRRAEGVVGVDRAGRLARGHLWGEGQ